MRWNDFVDTTASVELNRLTLLEEIFDPFSIRNLGRTGIGPGTRCLEVGAGAGSIARWMGERAGFGNVVATDLSTEYLHPLTELGIEVIRHDVSADPAPGEFDVIHCRFVLDHIPTRDDVLKRLASWLRPGGWLVMECATTMPELSCEPVVRRAMEALNRGMTMSVNTHITWCRGMPLHLEDAGLGGCGAEGQALPVRGGSPLARWLVATHKLVEEAIVEAGLITADELEAAYAIYDSPSYVDYTWMTIGTWGRRV